MFSCLEPCPANGIFGINETNCGSHYDNDIEAKYFLLKDEGDVEFQKYWKHQESKFVFNIFTYSQRSLSRTSKGPIKKFDMRMFEITNGN